MLVAEEEAHASSRQRYERDQNEAAAPLAECNQARVMLLQR